MNKVEFAEQYTAFMKRALEIAQKARRESLLCLGSVIDNEKADQRDIFEYGLRFAYEGTDLSIIEKILGNIIAQEKDEYTHLYKTIQREAVCGIHQGDNAKIIFSKLNSLTDLPLTDDKAFADIISMEPKPPSHEEIDTEDDKYKDYILPQDEIDGLLSNLNPEDGKGPQDSGE
jgi:flagellar motor component MotA